MNPNLLVVSHYLVHFGGDALGKRLSHHGKSACIPLTYLRRVWGLGDDKVSHAVELRNGGMWLSIAVDEIYIISSYVWRVCV